MVVNLPAVLMVLELCGLSTPEALFRFKVLTTPHNPGILLLYHFPKVLTGWVV